MFTSRTIKFKQLNISSGLSLLLTRAYFQLVIGFHGYLSGMEFTDSFIIENLLNAVKSVNLNEEGKRKMRGIEL